MSDFGEIIDRLRNPNIADPDRWGKRTGEPLSQPIRYEGRQWALTDIGIECRNGTHVISKDRLWADEGTHGWILHMAEKEWVDLEDFIVCLGVARAFSVSCISANECSDGRYRNSKTLSL